jgi:DNA helicase IV
VRAGRSTFFVTDQTSGDLESREIAHEQAVVDRVYEQLDKATRNAALLAQEGHDRARLGHEGGLVERDAMVYQSARRIATLDAAHEGLVFGRLDLVDGQEAPRYVGRIGLRDDGHESMLIDWRAPAAAVFYQATPTAPGGVARRRVLRCRGKRVIGVEDDLLDAEAAGDLPIVGEGALLAQLSRARDRSMHSIVATIQAAQDKAIRAPAMGVVEIAGGPGTGKTVVALHRAAYLLYTDRSRYERGGVLVVGPSGVFMRYIERVLPSLGETTVSLRAMGEVVEGVEASRHDVPAVATVKGAERMAELLRRASRQTVPGAPDELRYFYRDDVLRLTRRDLANARRSLLGHGRRNSVSRTRAASHLVELLWRQVSGERALERSREDFSETVLNDDRFLLFLREWWPPLYAAQVLGWLRDPGFLARVGEGVLSPADVQALSRPDAWVTDEHDLSIEDVALVDELRHLLGEPPEEPDEVHDPLAHLVDANMPELTTISDREFAGPRATRRIDDDIYAHVLVDEAQDLTPMQWRMLGRRGRTATWTIVGDPAQSSWPFPEEAERARDEALRSKARYRFHLDTNYRNSAEIYRFAADYADRVGLQIDLPTAVRSTGVDPAVLADSDDVRATTVKEADRMLGELEGTVAVVAAGNRRAEVRGWFADHPEATGDDQARLAVLTGLETKGLEFDGIVVVEPEAIEQESVTGRATLYVVLTRATQQLSLVS